MNQLRSLSRIVLLTVLALATPAAALARDLTFEDRVAAQTAIERTRYAHRIDATEPFEAAVPREVIEKKVENYLRENAALERLWNAPVTAAMLEREMRRMAKASPMPARLAELFAALGDDAFLIQECLVRPALVDRLARHQFESDPEIHQAARLQALKLRGELTGGTLDPRAEHPSRHVQELRLVRNSPTETDAHEPGVVAVPSADFARLRAGLPRRSGEIGPLTDDPEAYSVHVVLEQDAGRIRVATYAVPKLGWDEWWARTRSGLLALSPHVSAQPGLPVPRLTPSGGAPCDGEAWSPGVMDAVPIPRTGHTAVWTGTEMLVWGGNTIGSWTQTGMRYDPPTDTWTPMSTVNAPSRRSGHAAVWTGSLMVVWGAAPPFGGSNTNTGGRYDPLTDTWSPTSLVGVPQARSNPTAVWTGSVVVFWGGYANSEPGSGCNCCSVTGGTGCNDASCQAAVCAFDPFCCSVAWDQVCADEAAPLAQCACCSGSGGGTGPVNSGGRYDPATDTWLPTSVSGAPTPRSSHSAVWAGNQMIVWGGSTPTLTNTGGRYDPVIDAWAATPTAGAPIARNGHRAVWTGTQMIVWGGVGAGTAQNTGGRYSLATNSWSGVSVSGAPTGRSSHAMVWTGSRMIVWGGMASSQPSNTGGRYDPATDSWTPTSTAGAPLPRLNHSMIWTGTEAIIWGGDPNFANGFYEVYGTGGRYDPDTDSWAPTFQNNTPLARTAHTAVWTGAEMIVWGGGIVYSKTPQYLATGGRYDPATDAWTPTATSGAPSARYQHTAVWSGTRMIVWGGITNFFYTDTGGRYDPVADAWTPTSQSGVPTARVNHTAVWIGNRMIVWGGSGASGYQATGGRYSPATDSWSATSMIGVPVARELHTAVSTGAGMIVWGGYGAPGQPLQTGGLYNPTANAWSATVLSGAPTARYQHTAVWTGSQMIVWGGYAALPDTGGRYDPAAHTWLPVSDAGEPIGAIGHSAVWTGQRMIVWGGSSTPSGGQYDPVADAWQTVTTTGAPEPRSAHSAVWTGSKMVVWGGIGSEVLASGGIYDPDGTDFDGDNVGCGLDCDDGDPTVFGFPVAVVGMRFEGDKATLDWPSLKAALGNATAYDIARGSVSEFPVGGGTSESCLASGYSPPPAIGSGLIKLVDTDVPVAGGAFWYVVRVTNPCGIGTYGSTSAGSERVTAACP